jgi:hypothetical protein
MTCKHERIQTWSTINGHIPVGLWNCVDCGQRFEPLQKASKLRDLIGELRHIAARCEMTDGDYCSVSVQMWAEEWIRRIENES